MQILELRGAIYDQFHHSSAGSAFFFLPENADAYAAYYTAMYLLQDTAESVQQHMEREFASDPWAAYLEFWGVMQAINIQQDAITEMHRAVTGQQCNIAPDSAWKALRNLRHLCAGHPASRRHGLPAPQRTFMRRGFGSYARIQYELWDASTGNITHPVFDLRALIGKYDLEASAILTGVLSTMRTDWP